MSQHERATRTHRLARDDIEVVVQDERVVPQPSWWRLTWGSTEPFARVLNPTTHYAASERRDHRDADDVAGTPRTRSR